MGNTQKAVSSKAILTLVLGILSLLCFGFITGIPSIIIGLQEIKSIKEGVSSKEGDVFAKTGLALGIAGTAIWVFMIMIGLIFTKLGVSAGI